MYASNEENLLDWEGNIIDRAKRQQILLADFEHDDAMAVSVQVGSVEVKAIDVAMK